MSLTYDSVGSGQGALRAPSRFPVPAALRWGPTAPPGAFRARLVHAADGCIWPAGQKNLLQNAYDYAISDVPLSEAVYNSSSKCAPSRPAEMCLCLGWAHCATAAGADAFGCWCRDLFQIPFAISSVTIVYNVTGAPPTADRRAVVPVQPMSCQRCAGLQRCADALVARRHTDRSTQT